MLANCTCTLIRGKNTLTIVDTRTPWDGEEMVNGTYNDPFHFELRLILSYILSELKKQRVEPSDITHVICTHGHSDHIGCNYLFLNAQEHIVGHAISNRDVYRTIEDESDYITDDGIRVMKTAGHTMDSVRFSYSIACGSQP